MIVYAGEPDEYFTFVSREAYYALESWIEYRTPGEDIGSDSWLMRNLWNSIKTLNSSLQVGHTDAFAYYFNSILTKVNKHGLFMQILKWPPNVCDI